LIQWEVQYNFALVQQFSAAMTSTALLTGQVFPHVTHPHFEIGAGYVDGMGGIMTCAFAPLVKAEERSDWEEYATENQWWLQESVRLRIAHPEKRDPLHGTIQDHEHDRVEEDQLWLFEIPPIRKRIWNWEDGNRTIIEEEESDTEIVAPLWQISPPEARTVNVNLFYDERITDLYDAMVATNQTVLSSETKIYDLFDFAIDDSEKERKETPHGLIMDPVYSTFENQTIVGFLMALTPFDNLLKRLLPEDAKGIIAVITNTCGKEMTFELNGINATFLGYEDLHDPDFDEYEFSKVMELYETIAENLCVHTVRHSKRVW
jgi:hypothetical protein